MRTVTLALLSMFVITLAGCEEKKKDETTSATTAPKANEPVKAKPAEPVKPAEPAAAPAAGGAADTGVAECDEYINKMMKCLDSPQYPAAAKDQAKQAFEQMKTGWKQALSASPEAKASIGPACKQALDAMKQSGAAMCPGVF